MMDPFLHVIRTHPGLLSTRPLVLYNYLRNITLWIVVPRSIKFEFAFPDEIIYVFVMFNWNSKTFLFLDIQGGDIGKRSSSWKTNSFHYFNNNMSKKLLCFSFHKWFLFSYFYSTRAGRLLEFFVYRSSKNRLRRIWRRSVLTRLKFREPFAFEYRGASYPYTQLSDTTIVK